MKFLEQSSGFLGSLSIISILLGVFSFKERSEKESISYQPHMHVNHLKFSPPNKLINLPSGV